jgi:Rrf2 family iron-sulfur cluster assembly transcriptional regulator
MARSVRSSKKPKPSLRVASGVSPLSQTAEYAFRAMACLAQERPGPALRATDLSALTHVPVHYLSKVLRRLVAAGLLSSQKGHGGGFELSRPATEIRFADVLAAVGEAPAQGRCAFGWGNCDARHPCPLHPAWSALTDSLMKWADTTTLSDVACDGPPRRASTTKRRTPSR